MKLNKNKGFTIIEVLCAISVFSILSTYIICFELNSIKTKKYIEVKSQNIKLLEAVLNELSSNCSYEELIALYNSGEFYITKENLNFDNILNNNIKTIVTNSLGNKESYIVLNFNIDKVLKIEATLYFKFMNKEEMIKWETYKGNY